MNTAVIFAGGVGRRMNNRALPKQFLKVYGKEIIVYTLEHFEQNPGIDAIVVACVEDWINFMKSLVCKYGLHKVKAVVPGGMTGQDSIYEALKEAERLGESEEDIVLIHDGVRPLINQDIITDCIACVREHGSAITIAPVVETILRMQEGTVAEVIERADCRVARAPQCFFLRDILKEHEKARLQGRHDFIDSATMMRYYGHDLTVVEGPSENIKITTPMDYYTFKAINEAKDTSQLFGG